MINREEDIHDFSEQGEMPGVFSPWRRFFARMFDISLYNIVWSGALALFFQENLLRRRGFENYLDTIVILVLMLFLEPILLRYFKTTPGKKILGLRIENSEGNPLSYKEGFERTFGVVAKGMGFNFPIVNLFFLYRSYGMLGEGRTLSWDHSTAYIVEDRKKYRIVIYLLGTAMSMMIFVTLVLSQGMPPNRGELTIPEFVENHNYYVEYYDINHGNRILGEDGSWQEEAHQENVVNIYGYPTVPEYHFILEEDVIKEVSLIIEARDVDLWVESYERFEVPAALAFAGAQEDMGVFSRGLEQIVERINEHGFEDGQFSVKGNTFQWEIEHTGFEDMGASGYLYPIERGEDNYFFQKFSITR